jgi:hypothetical protein
MASNQKIGIKNTRESYQIEVTAYNRLKPGRRSEFSADGVKDGVNAPHNTKGGRGGILGQDRVLLIRSTRIGLHHYRFSVPIQIGVGANQLDKPFKHFVPL